MALTAKQEKFCQKYMETGNASEAYRQSYNCVKSTDKSIHELSSTLLKNINVSSRVKELKENTQKRHEITVDDLIKELEEARQIAIGKDGEKSIPSAMVSATMGKAKLLGLDITKIETNQPIVVQIVKFGEQ